MVLITLVLLMLALSCCQSSRVEYKTVYVYPQLYFPKKPAASPLELPLDEHFKVVKSDYDAEGKPIKVEWVLTPYWLYKLRTDYTVYVDTAEAEYKAFMKSIENEN